MTSIYSYRNASTGSSWAARGNRSITAGTALRLARFFGTSERFWLNLQVSFDLDLERDRMGDRLAAEVEVLAKAS